MLVVLNHEVTASYTVVVRATDSLGADTGEDPALDATVTITVTDVNEPPECNGASGMANDH